MYEETLAASALILIFFLSSSAQKLPYSKIMRKAQGHDAISYAVCQCPAKYVYQVLK